MSPSVADARCEPVTPVSTMRKSDRSAFSRNASIASGESDGAPS